MTTARRSRTAPRRFDRAAYERQVEEFIARVNEERYLNGAGLKDELALGPLYREHEGLFSRTTVDALRTLVDTGGDETERNRALLAFATDGLLEREAAGLTDAIATAESRAVIRWRGESIPYRAARPRISGIADRGPRNALFGSWLEAVEQINPLRQERLDVMHAAATDLGYGDYVELVRVTRGWDPDALDPSTRTMLNDTETGFYAAIRRTQARIGIEQGDGSLADAWYMLRGIGWDAWFEGRRLTRLLQATFAGIGVDLAGQSGATLDFEDRPRKSPRAFCSVVRAPGDVRLVVRPTGGWDDFAAALHEAGHLEHFLHVAPKAPISLKLLGDYSVTEGYAIGLENLVGESVYLGEQVGMPFEDTIAFADFYALFSVNRMRHLAGLFLYQLGLHRGGLPAVHRASYAGMVGLLTGVRVPEELYLAEVDDGLYAGTYLRATMLAGALDESLARRHGMDWWRRSAAGDELRSLFARGTEWNAEQVVAHLGYDALDWRPVLRKIRTQLIGEMSGYGGPNITTRAGSRKV
jgi:hypothetical protein